jgi:hypothetical protein
MEQRDEGLSDEDMDRLTWKIIESTGIPFSITEEGNIHVDVDAIKRWRAEEIDDDGDTDEGTHTHPQ